MNYEKLPKTISAEELLSTPLPPVKWIIPNLLPAGLALFAGPSKAGKSWLTLWLCLQVAQGKPMWGREIEPHTVLYLSLEDTFNRLQKRLLQLVGSEEAPERLVMQTECASIGQGLEEQLTSFLYQHPDTGLIVIDTLQKVRSSDQNNSMYASDYKEISALKALADKYNVCILLIHHLRKQAADDPFQQIAGSNGLMGASDTSWVMQRKRMSQTASILVTGRDMDNKTLRLHEENCVWILDEEESTEQIVAKAVPSYLWKVADYIPCPMWTARSTSNAAASMPSSGQHPTSCAGSTTCRWWSSPRPRNRRGTPGCARPSTKPVRMPAPPRIFTERCIGKGIFSAVIHTENMRPYGRGMVVEPCDFIGWEKNTILQP